MLFKKDTLTDDDKVALVNSIAVGSLVKYFNGGDLFTAHERSLIANELIAKMNGGCSTWTKSKLTAYTDNLATLVIKTPDLYKLFEELITRGELEEASDRLAHFTYNGLKMNGYITGYGSSFGSKPFLDNLDVELENLLHGGEEKDLEEYDNEAEYIEAKEEHLQLEPQREDKTSGRDIKVGSVITLRTPKKAYYSKNYKLNWMVEKFEHIKKGQVIFKLVDGDDCYEHIAEHPCELISCEEDEHSEINRSEILLGRLKVLEKFKNTVPSDDLQAKLEKLKTLYDNGLVSEDVYHEKQNKLLEEL